MTSRRGSLAASGAAGIGAGGEAASGAAEGRADRAHCVLADTGPPAGAQACAPQEVPYHARICPPETVFGARRASQPSRVDTLRRYEARINRVIDFIASDPTRDFTLDDLAGAAPFSRFHFHRIFATTMGETVQAFIRRLRLEKAVNLLVFTPSMRITDVSLECGFSSSQNFARAFKERYGLSPGDYRRLHGLVAVRKQPDTSGAERVGREEGRENGNGGNVHPAAAGYPVDMPDGASRVPSYPPYVRLEPDTARSDAMDVEVKELPACRVAYLRHIGPYGHEGIGPVWNRLMQWAGRKGLLKPGVSGFGVSWDNPEVTPADRCRYDACIEIGDDLDPVALAEEGVSVQTLPGGMYGEYRTSVDSEGFYKAWCDMFGQWLPSSGWQCDERPCFEMYRDMSDCSTQGPWNVSICLAVRPL